MVAETGKGTARYVVKAKDYVAEKAVGAEMQAKKSAEAKVFL